MTTSGEKMKMKTQVLLGKDKQHHQQQKTTVRINQPNTTNRVGVMDAAVLTSKHEMKQSFVSTDTDLASSEPFQMKKA